MMMGMKQEIRGSANSYIKPFWTHRLLAAFKHSGYYVDGVIFGQHLVVRLHILMFV
jgi:hypothetical protein